MTTTKKGKQESSLKGVSKKVYPKPTIEQLREVIDSLENTNIDNTYLHDTYGWSIGLCNKVIFYLSNTRYRQIQDGEKLGFPLLVRNWKMMIDKVMYDKGYVRESTNTDKKETDTE